MKLFKTLACLLSISSILALAGCGTSVLGGGGGGGSDGGSGSGSGGGGTGGANPNGHGCEGFIANAYHCPSGYTCVHAPGSLPDEGGICLPSGS